MTTLTSIIRTLAGGTFRGEGGEAGKVVYCRQGGEERMRREDSKEDQAITSTESQLIQQGAVLEQLQHSGVLTELWLGKQFRNGRQSTTVQA